MASNKINFRKAYSSHNPVLIKVFQNTDGSILEIGSGFFSTPLLHWLADKNRKVLTLESVPEYFDFAHQFRSKSHKVKLVNFDDVKPSGYWSMVFIDHETERRSIEAVKFKDNADYIIVHDSEGEVYGYEKIYPLFKYVYHYKRHTPYTTILSNFKDPSLLWN